MKIYWTAACFPSVALYLSSVRRRSSSSWILFSSWETPAEERDWPSISATRLLSSFSCRDRHGQTAGQHTQNILEWGQGGYVLSRLRISVTDDHKRQQSEMLCTCYIHVSPWRSCPAPGPVWRIAPAWAQSGADRSGLCSWPRGRSASPRCFSPPPAPTPRASACPDRDKMRSTLLDAQKRDSVHWISPNERFDGAEFGNVSV